MSRPAGRGGIPDLTPEDRRRLQRLGIPEDEVRRQLALLADPPLPARLVRPCRRGDGIRVLSAAEQERFTARAAAAAREGRLSKFVPASGAATRMFRAPLAVLAAASGEIRRRDLERDAAGGDRAAADVVALLDGLDRIAFGPELAAAMAASGLDLDRCLGEGRIRPVLEHLLTPAGLGYAERPKGLIPFHRYPDGARTPLDEQLAEAAATIRDAAGACRLHVTVPPGGEEPFERRLAAGRRLVDPEGGTAFEVSFSLQDRATDTVAATPEGKPFRLADGSLCLRPGGHGALLGNLQRTGGDLVFIKNIDNVLPDRLRGPTVRWKMVLAGLLVELEEEACHHLDRLNDEADGGAVEAAARFAAEVLAAPPPEGAGSGETRRLLRERLDRPLRVCGMVENRGEPGGGPFWVGDAGGAVAPQIVETAQIDTADPDQAAVLAAATHFNPVDLVCALRDVRGRPHDLGRFVDPRTAFVTEKTLEGRRLLALEHPGLWNGAMAGWNSVFVEVPPETFAPVKTVLDLLRPEHQG